MKRILVEKSVPRDGNDARARRSRSVTVNLAESPLGWLRARGKVSDRQFAAGEMLRQDYEKAALAPQVTMRWDALPAARLGRGAPTPGAGENGRLDAKRRFQEAIATAGSGLEDILWRVVCAGETVPFAERALGWPVRAGRLVLTLALDRVADYYRLA